MKERTYVAIDLKSFYASVECVQRGLDPMNAFLVVADGSRTEKTICLAVSPPLKEYGISGRARLFEVVERVREVNALRRSNAPGRQLTGATVCRTELERDPALALDYIVAPPRMAQYMEVSARIYNVYLKYIAPEDIHVYSIDEVFMDVTHYLDTYGVTARELARTMILDVLNTTGITAAAGIGTNLYLCKAAMDILAKHEPADEYGVRIAELDEQRYRRLLWEHRPLTDFWRVGRGYANRLAEQGLYTMGDVARCSLGRAGEYYSEDLLYRMFGKNAELLIDHAWGWEPCTISDIKAYKPAVNSLCSGQVLHCPYSAEKARLITKEMTDQLVLDLVDRELVTDQLVLTVGYDIDNVKNGTYRGEVRTDHYGRQVPKHAHGTVNLERHTSSANRIRKAVDGLYERIVDPHLLVRRITLTANRILRTFEVPGEASFEQLDLFTDYVERKKQREREEASLERERKLQQAVLSIKKKHGRNAILKGMDLEDGATAADRNRQIGGHRA